MSLILPQRGRIQSAAGGPVRFLSATEDQVDRTVYTFSGIDSGETATGRIIVVGAYGRDAGTNALDINSVTVNGEATTGRFDNDDNSSQSTTGLYSVSAAVENDVTLEVIVTFDQEVLRCGIMVWALYGFSTGVATGTNGGNPITSACTLAAGDCVIAIASGSGGGVTDMTWTDMPLNEDYSFDAFGGAPDYVIGGSYYSEGGITDTIEATAATGVNETCLTKIIFSP